MEFSIQDKALVIFLEKDFYPEDIILKCFYWYTDKYDIEFSIADSMNFRVKLTCKDVERNNDTWGEIQSKIKRDLLDFKLRKLIIGETTNVRDLLIAKAFAYEEEVSPNTPISDPVGFNPLDPHQNNESRE